MQNKRNSLALDNYRFFVAIVEAGSLTKASADLGIPKSKLSRRLAQLEQQLGSQLLIRTTRTITLTESGHLLYQQCQPHVAALTDVEQFIYDSHHQIKGELKLLLPLEFFNQVIGELITTFATQYSDLQIQCQHYTGTTPPYDHQFDLVFVLHEGSLPNSNWISKSLLSFSQSIYVSERDSSVSVNEIAQLNNIDAILADRSETWLLREHGKVTELNPKPVMMLASPEMRAKACEQGIGVIKLPDYIGKQIKGIKTLNVSAPVVAQQLSVLYHSRNIPLKTRIFLDFFQSKIGCLSS
ncbi:LysR family transcriptional regulator [Thalassotalea sp. 1_MG-2023]|uniref:LysR family transcriptional regulator n=1 Tax=Thalassotalea sp. 1_MG-2023 TaxID=3062680 RepID=UPI0026E3ECCF|nr:LysR family transcriptional regulator [Thalassotalea sp. 1_MG-2023]MDO6426348.1 LysR family transcriptional regulator [Thalassotalea sp. 1_MG-2023]